MPSVFICAPAALIPWVWDNLIVKPRLKKLGSGICLT